RVKMQYDYVRSDGTADMTIFETAAIPAGYTNDTLDHQAWDDYKKDSFQIKAIYDITESLVSTVGYAYEKYEYNDNALDNYDYKINSADYLSGAYKDQSYEANVVFASLKYSF
ncbi:MAG: MtrB/PioB family outer membrane beta-barrel protein, partial [Proteobacteria bacterium]|nr:MtrB/PioB family outer membrane beta-barrel protein [Pseudomonadota bacterium]